MVPEELSLGGASFADRPALRDVLLAPVHHTDVSEPQRDNFASDARDGVGAAVHDVELGDDADGPFAHGIHELGQCECVGVGEVGVGGGDGEDEARFAFDVGEDHVSDAFLDVGWLVPDWDARDAREVHQGHGEDVRGANLEADLLVRDAFVVAGAPVGFALDLFADGFKLGEDLVWAVEELAPLHRRLVVVARVMVRRVHELEHERAARADVGAARQEIAADERLEHGGLPGGLRAHDRNLRELQVAADILHARLREDILELVDQGDEAVP